MTEQVGLDISPPVGRYIFKPSYSRHALYAGVGGHKLHDLNRIFIIPLLLVASCSQYASESLKDFIEYRAESNNYVRWTPEQEITMDLFLGEPSSDAFYYHYFGIYYYYDLRDGLKFNVTIYFDKVKSWARPKSEWGESIDLYYIAPKLLKLKFDYYEYGARLLRKYLKEHENELTNEKDVRFLADKYRNIADSEFMEIYDNLNFDFSEPKLLKIRQLIDLKLTELDEFDESVNSKF